VTSLARIKVPALLAGLACLLLFAADCALSWHARRLGFDLPLESDVRAIGWGPLVPLMNATNWLADWRQAAAWLILSALLLAVTRWGALVFFAGALASGVEELLKPIVREPRPLPQAGFGFPSGHATFYTWVVILLLFVLQSRLPAWLRPAAWLAGAFVIFVGCLGRIWSAEHWPSQVIGGFLLGAGWALVVVAISRSVSWRADKTTPQT
jgi:membrane-associated phospholipid phosphatase